MLRHHLRRTPLHWLLVALLLLTGPACSLLPSRTAPATPTPAAAEDRVALTLGDPVELLTATVPVDGGTLTVSRPGDPLDGLSITVPAGAYGDPVAFRVSYRPIQGYAAPDGFAPITPLLHVDNGGRLADQVVTVRLPAKIPDGRFAMAFYYDEETGELEGLPTLAIDDESLTVMTLHFSTLVVTAADYADLEHFSFDTGFTPGKDTWQIENRGSYLAPGGICWGMSVSSLWYYLEEPWRIAGERLWGRYDSDLGPELKTPGFWQDDTLAVMVASAVQQSCKRSASSRDYNLVHRLEEAAQAAGYVVNIRLTADEISFYSLVMAMELTHQPQLMTVWTADGKEGHALICYKVEAGKLYVADPNDNGANPPERTIVFKDGKFEPYTSAQNLEDLLAGHFFDYPSVRYWGVSALVYWQEVGKLWSAGIWQEGYPPYRLLVIERDADGNVSQEYDLDLNNPLTISQDALELELIPQPPLEARLRMARFVEGGPPLTDASFQSGPLSLAPGRNLVGIYLEGKATWVDPHNQKHGEWRWLGFQWVEVVVEEAAEEPTATKEAGPEATATRPSQNAGFTAEDCACAGVVPPGYTPMDASSYIPKQGEYTVKSRSQGQGLSCEVQWRADSLVSVKTDVSRQPDEQDAAQLAETFRWNHDRLLSPDAIDPTWGAEVDVLEDEADSRLTMTTYVGNKNHVFYGTWYGNRLLIYKGSLVQLSVAGLTEGGQEGVLQALDAAEACATAAIDRYDAH